MIESGQKSGQNAPNAKFTADNGLIGLLCLVATLEGMDLMLLGATFHSLSVSLGISPVHLALLATAQGVLKAMSGIMWAILTDRGVLSRRSVLCCGALGLGLVTIGLGAVSDLYSMVILRGLNGICLGCVAPIAQAIIADTLGPAVRGVGFGYFNASIKIGQLIAMVLAVPLSHKIVYGMHGWRIAYFGVGSMSVLVAVIVFMLTTNARVAPVSPGNGNELERFIGYFKVKTVSLIIGQGISARIPFSALTFLTMYFQLAGMTDWDVTFLVCCGLIADVAGNVLGGTVSDGLEEWWPTHGRPLCAQLNLISSKPCMILMLIYIEPVPDNFNLFLLLTVLFNLFGTWCLSAVSYPILSQLAAPEERSSMFAINVAFEGSSSAIFGTMLVGILAEHAYGYPLDDIGVQRGPNAPHVKDVAADRLKAEALGKALAMVCGVAWSLCLCFYSLLHVTYGPDLRKAEKRHAQAQAQGEKEALLKSA